MVCSIKVASIFNSNIRPKLLELEYSELFPSSVIIQKPGDLRRDFFVQTMFFIFNQIWKSTPFSNIVPSAGQYMVLPACKEFGFIEVASGMQSVDKVNFTQISWTEQKRNNLISTAAGGFIASFVLGIRDRHRDNMMFNTETGNFIHIDFGYLFNYTSWFDANRFAIPFEFKTLLGTDWNSFEAVCMEGYVALRRNCGMLVHFCRKLFSTVYSETDIIGAFNSAFYHNLTETDAAVTVKNLVDQGVASKKKKIKDFFHSRVVALCGEDMCI